MKDRLKRIYDNTTLTTKIRCSYLLLLFPLLLFLIICFYNLWDQNRQYEDMINSVLVASDFSLDFKKDYDYETYLLIVGNKSMEESRLEDLLQEANRIVQGLEKLTVSPISTDRLNSVKKYLTNLETYKERIEENLEEGNKYEENIEIWENDVQIVTSLLRESVFQYIFYEIRDVQQAREEYQNLYMAMIRIFAIAFILIALLITLLSYYIPLSITRPIRELRDVTKQVAKGDLSVRAKVQAGAEVAALGGSLNTMIDKINELLEQVTKEQIRLRKAEFEILQSQINPHFLYNTLDTIVWLAEAGEQKKVVGMVGSLSEFFRTSLNHGKDIVSVKEELQHVRSYLEIQQIRYQDILEYEICVPEDLEKYRIPKITIQPLVENALYHGIKNKRGLGKIVISGKMEEYFFLLQIQDNGIGMREERLEQITGRICRKVPAENYGLYNVNERIRLNFGEAYGISVKSTYGKGTIVSVRLPYEKNKP